MRHGSSSNGGSPSTPRYPTSLPAPVSLAALGGIASAAIAMGGAAWRAGHRSLATTYGSARWADVSDLKSAHLFAKSGVILGLYDGRYLRHDGPEHVLLVAPTRSGKGVGLVLPTLLSWTQSAVIHDIKGENWALTAGWRSRFSHCLLFDPTDPRSARFNPLLEVRKGPQEVRDVQNIADILVDPEGARERRDHWDKAAHALLTGAILHVLYAEGDKTLARVATLLADPSRSILRTLQIMLTTNHVGSEEKPMAHPVVASIAQELLNKSDNERSGVVSTAMSLLGLYRDPLIAANTARSDWRIADLMHARRPVSLYLVVPPSDISRTRPLVRLVLNQIARQLTETLGSQRSENTAAPTPVDDRRVSRARSTRVLRIVAGVPGGLWGARLPGRAVPPPDRQGLRAAPRHPRQLSRPRRLHPQRRAHRQTAVRDPRYGHRTARAEEPLRPPLCRLAVAHFGVRNRKRRAPC